MTRYFLTRIRLKGEETKTPSVLWSTDMEKYKDSKDEFWFTCLWCEPASTFFQFRTGEKYHGTIDSEYKEIDLHDKYYISDKEITETEAMLILIDGKVG